LFANGHACPALLYASCNGKMQYFKATTMFLHQAPAGKSNAKERHSEYVQHSSVLNCAANERSALRPL